MNAEKVGHHSCVCQWCQALARPAIVRVALNKCGTQCVALFHIVWQVVLHWGERKTEVPEAQRERDHSIPTRDQLLVRATPGS